MNGKNNIHTTIRISKNVENNYFYRYKKTFMIFMRSQYIPFEWREGHNFKRARIQDNGSVKLRKLDVITVPYILVLKAKQLNSLTTTVTLSWLGGAEVTHPLWEKGPGFNSQLRKGILCLIVVSLLLWLYFFVQKHIICHTFLQFLYEEQKLCKICDWF